MSPQFSAGVLSSGVRLRDLLWKGERDEFQSNRYTEPGREAFLRTYSPIWEQR